MQGVKYEISVRPVTRYIVTEYHEVRDNRGEIIAQTSAGCGEFDNKTIAIEAARGRGAMRRGDGHEDVTVIDGEEVAGATIE